MHLTPKTPEHLKIPFRFTDFTDSQQPSDGPGSAKGMVLCGRPTFVCEGCGASGLSFTFSIRSNPPGPIELHGSAAKMAPSVLVQLPAAIFALRNN